MKVAARQVIEEMGVSREQTTAFLVKHKKLRRRDKRDGAPELLAKTHKVQLASQDWTNLG